jgi:magnesium transporter
MLRVYCKEADKLVEVPAEAPVSVPTEAEGGPPAPARPVVWFDLLNPTPEEDREVEQRLGITIPSRAEMEEIELSSRLYTEDGAEFMTMVALTNLDAEEPSKTPITFILKKPALVTVRYAEPKPFLAYATRATRPGMVPCQSGEQVMFGIIEAMIDRDADALERAGNEIDGISRDVFRTHERKANKRQRSLSSIIEQIGRKEDLLTMIQESLVSITRLVSYHNVVDAAVSKAGKDSRTQMKAIQRDALSLGDHARALSDKLTFLLDATLGLINLEQNQIIKLFSVAAVVFLPPTLVASIYGMNFHFMPELSWPLGYPFALGLMVLSAILPYLYFKRKGWL